MGSRINKRIINHSIVKSIPKSIPINKRPSSLTSCSPILNGKKGQRVFVVGGGPSLKDFDFSRLSTVDTIVVNNSIFDVPNPNYFITVDYMFLKKINIHNFRSIDTTKIFVVDLHYPYIKEANARIVDTRIGMIYNLNDFDFIIKSHADSGIGYNLDDFRTGLNSGFCAMQLAVVLGYKEIVLLGFDLNSNTRTHYHDGYGEGTASFDEKLDLYYKYFSHALKTLNDDGRTKVISCSVRSRLNGIIEYIDIDRIL